MWEICDRCSAGDALDVALAMRRSEPPTTDARRARRRCRRSARSRRVSTAARWPELPPQDEFAPIEDHLDEAVECDDYALVVGLVDRALTLPEAGPELAGFLDTLGWAFERLGRFDEAVDVMRRAAAAGLDTTFDEHPSTRR